MKLQYLGDVRDAFKWDFLHWMCTRSLPSFDELAFVPFLTPDVKGSKEGRTPHHWFECRDFIRPFVVSLKKKPRSLLRIEALGIAQSDCGFRISVHSPENYIVSGKKRIEYWRGFKPEKLANSVVFFDPDNGFETKTQHGPKWILHAELKDLLSRLPDTSAAIVYQHRPRRTWVDLFDELEEKLNYAHTSVAAYESNLAFLALANNLSTAKRIISAIQRYSEEHPVVRYKLLRNGD